MAKEPVNPPDAKTMQLTPAEQRIIERVRMTPAERRAEQDARRQARLDAMTSEQRQAEEQRAAKLAAMTPGERRTFFAGNRLAGMAKMLKRETEYGVSLVQIVASQETEDAEFIAWLGGKLTKPAEEK